MNRMAEYKSDENEYNGSAASPARGRSAKVRARPAAWSGTFRLDI